MAEQAVIHPLLLSLQEKSELLFGFKILSWAPISLGWLNLKWKLETDQGEFLLKQYHAKRYSNEDVLIRALEQQQRLFKSGLPCPELLAVNGTILHTFSDEKFVIMQFCTGEIVKPKDINIDKMYDLGRVTGMMHRILNDGSLGAEGHTQFIPQNRQDRISHWSNVIEELKGKNKTHFISQIELHMKLTKTIDIDSFGKSIPGWSHRDLWADNLLFKQDQVSAVLDFDRLNYDYPEIDVSRAILSWSIHNGNFRTELASAFLQGYRTVNEFPAGKLVSSLRMLWYLESVWWINANMEHHNNVQARFAEEMAWLAENDDKLPAILGGI